MFELRVFLALSFINQFSCMCIVFRVTPCWTATKTCIFMQIYKKITEISIPDVMWHDSLIRPQMSANISCYTSLVTKAES